MTLEQDCPDCSADEFYRVASTNLHLGEKAKYRCEDCGYGFVRIDGVVDTSTA